MSLAPSAPGGSLDAKDIKVLIRDETGELIERTVSEALGDLVAIGGPLGGTPIDSPVAGTERPIDL